MIRSCPKLVRSWNHFGTTQCLRRYSTGKIFRHYSSLHRITTATIATNNSAFFKSSHHNITDYKLFHTESSHDENINEESSSFTEKQLPVPQFKNVLEHLKQLSSIFSSNTSEYADFCSLLDQLGSEDKFSSSLNDALKEKMTADKDWLVRQSEARIENNILQNRSPLPIWSNSAFLYPNLTQQRELSASFLVDYISATILSILDYRSKLSKTSPEKMKSIFGSFRSPGSQIDSQNFSYDPNMSEYSIVLSRQSNFFQVELNNQMASGEIFFVLKKVVEFILNYKNDGTIPFGSLSTLTRTDATFGYQFINESGLKRLRESQVLINLDQIVLDSTAENIPQEELAQQILTSNSDSVGNRWFDKSIEFIMILGTKDKQQMVDHVLASGICFEKSLVTPESVIELMQHGIDFLTKFKPIEIKPESNNDDKLMIKVEKIDLVQPGKLDIVSSAVNDFALKKYSILIDPFRLSSFEFEDYGRQFIESINCQPDAWIQIALGLAYYNMKQLSNNQNNSPNHNAIRFEGLTREMLDFYEDPSSEEKLRIALESYQFYCQLAHNGYDIENILGVYELLIEEKKIPDANAKGIFKSLMNHPVLSHINHPLIYVTNSFHESKSKSTGIVELNGPLVPGGFGGSYQFRSNRQAILFTIGHHHHQGDDQRGNSSDVLQGDGPEVLRKYIEFLDHALMHMKSVIEC